MEIIYNRRMKLIAETIEEFFQNCDPKFKDDLIALDQMLTPLCPAGTRKLYNLDSITMLGYGEVILTTKAKGPQLWPIVGVAPQVHNISVYVNGEKDGIPIVTAYADNLGKVSCGKSCVRVTKLGKVNLPALKDLFAEALR